MSSTESFDSVISDMRLRAMGGPWATMADRLQYDHHQEIRDVSQKEYHRGYEDGKRSMDAVHRAVAIRLRQLPLDGDTTENLGAIAGAVYHSDFGCTQGACKALRDELVHLMGGTEGSVKEGKIGTADDSSVNSDCGDSGRDFHVEGVSAEKRIEKLVKQRDELQNRLSELETFDPDTALAAFGDDNDELRKLLSRVAQLLTQAEQDRDTNYANWMECKEKVLQKIITIDELSDERDRYKAACDAAQSFAHDMMDGLEDYIELPKDANSEHIHIGDVVERTDPPHKQSKVTHMTFYLGAETDVHVDERPNVHATYAPTLLRHCTQTDTAENIVRELTLGSITEEEAITRIEALHGNP